jgi:hypothetical protein
MNQTREFEIHGGGFHSLTIDDSHIKIESYTLGSLAGGTGTESSYAIDLTRRADFFKDMGISHGEELFQRLDTYTEIDWNNLRSMIQKYQTGSFVWMETDWSDSIKITEGTFDVMYDWYRGDSIDDPFRIIESARFETYTLIEADRGKYIRCGVSSRDNTGINSSFKPSETIGPIK